MRRIGGCMGRDRERLRGALLSLRRRAHAGESVTGETAHLAEIVERSLALADQRRARVPEVEFPPELPITASLQPIAAAIAAHPVVVVCGETGSGKTTQLPKLCLALGRGVTGVIGHTQPRRIAARSVASRIAQELGPEGSRLVGHKVRFSDRTRPETAVKLMTDGVLLAELQSDRLLLAYDTLIIDEAHERSLNIDFLLGYLKRLLARRPDLKVIVTSATIDPQRFSRHFGDAPVVEVPGRTYPVEVRYRPVAGADEDERDQGLPAAVLNAVDELTREGPGDVLIFLPGEREIRETSEALRKRHPPGTQILPLYARLGAAEQEQVFRPSGARRLVLATNVAETSLTVPGIRYVVDTGLARVSRYSHRTKVQRLPVERISQASADQRKGRCGRLGPGVCVRLYDEAEFALRPAYTDPEILRTSLAAVILRMEALGLGAVDRFPFVDPPDPRYVNDGYRLLAEIGAVDRERRLTGQGREIARLPVDPRLARMLLAAREEGCLAEVLVIVSALEVQDPRERPLAARAAADASHREFQVPGSDFLALLKLWEFYHEQARHLSRAKLRQLCRERFLSYVRMREWHDTHQQVLALLHDMGLRLNETPAEPARVHRALLSGVLGQIGVRRDDGAYRGARGTVFHLHPASGLAGKAPKWVMAAERVETSRLFARTVAAIDPAWVEPLAPPDLVRRHYAEPHWDPERGEVVAFEDVTLYGLPVVTRRPVAYGRVDPVAAREIFLRAALVAGDYRPPAPFLAHNRALHAEVAGLEDRARRQDILVDDEAIFAFYDARVPAGVASERQLEAWRRTVERNDPRHLFLSREGLMRHGAEGLGPERFPDAIEVAGAQLPLVYRFEPGHDADGVTVRVPLVLLPSLDAERFEWLVPGLLQEKLTAMIRALPRPVRRHYVPAPDFGRACAESLGPPRGPLREALARELLRMTGAPVPPEVWSPAALPAHLQMRFEVLGADGEVLGAGRDLPALREGLAGAVRSGLDAAHWPGLPREAARRWVFGDIPERVEASLGGVPTRGFPALTDGGHAVSVRVFGTAAEAERAHRDGLLRLFLLDLAPQVGALERHLPGLDAMCLAYGTLGPSPWGGAEDGPGEAGGVCAELRRDLLRAAAERCLQPEPGVRTEAAYRARRDAGRARLAEVAGQIARQVDEALRLFREAARRLDALRSPASAGAREDLRQQLGHLLYRGFVRATPEGRLAHLPRYLQAVLRRLDRVGSESGRDAARQAEVERLWGPCREALVELRARGLGDPSLEELRWLLEELRVSLFAQDLKTAVPVSATRLARLWEDLRGPRRPA
ncbi:MAG: ATP-dependent RNA helicase HrpA [Gammaproteobacteria bacterium]|nr:ATP-dependent RNA helicase HrpA [Gammaproteobacteria bacterium]